MVPLERFKLLMFVILSKLIALFQITHPHSPTVNTSSTLEDNFEMRAVHQGQRRSYNHKLMNQEKSILEETLQLLQQRVAFFSTNRISAENVLSQQAAYSVRSLSQIIPQLCRFDIKQTPLHVALADIYVGREYYSAPLETLGNRFLLPPVSEGEDSVTEDDAFEPSFKWVANTIIDSAFLLTDKIEPKKVQRGKVNPEWKGIVQLLLFGVERKIHLREQMESVQAHLKSRFEKYPWIKLKRVKELYYKGKPSILLRFADEISASFAYFNLATSSQKDIFGQGCELLRVIQNKLKERLSQDVTLVFRKLPLNLTKQALTGILKARGPIWMEELIEIEGFKYTTCKVGFLDEAFQVVGAFQAKNIKEAKVNYHPKSAKKWKINEAHQF